MPYPTVSELQAYLTAFGVGASDLSRIEPLLQDVLDSAVAAWETATGYSPFLIATDAEAEERSFSVRSNIVEFSNGVLNLEYSTSFEAYSNAAFPEQPIHAMRIGFYDVYTLGSTITATGLWGACTTLPAGVANAILSIAAQSLAGAISGTALTGGQVTKEKVGEVETTYASAASLTSSDSDGVLAGLPTAARSLALRYRRPRSGVA